METVLESGELTIRLAGRIDSANAEAVGGEIFDAVEKSGAGRVTLDAEKLEYISSAGLRILLQLKKTKPDSHIVNVSPEVYEILEVTGFVDIIDARKILREISVEGCEVIGEGGFGIVYRLDPDTIVKVYKNLDYDEIKKEMNLVKKAFIKGIPTAISFDIVKCGGRYGVVFELIKSDTLANRINREPERLDEYMEKFVALIRKLHSVTFEDDALMNANDLYRKKFEELGDLLSDGEMSELRRLIDAVPRRETVIHSDLHARNIMLQGDELLLIDMDELMCGHPIYDICEIYFAYAGLLGTGRAERYLGFTDEMCTRFLDKFTEIYFAGLSPKDRDKTVRALKVFGKYRNAYLLLIITKSRNPYEVRLKEAARLIREDVLPEVDLVIEVLNMIEW